MRRSLEFLNIGALTKIEDLAVIRNAADLTLAQSSVCGMERLTTVGLWNAIDDDGKMEKSLVRIVDSVGMFTGPVEKWMDPAKRDNKCEVHSDERNDKPVLGMTILRNARQDADDITIWTGVKILDTNNGKTYKTRLKLVNGSKTMELRGYTGFLYRTQVCQRGA
jgi:uncharacterized protein (DUF2147 family)